MRYTDATIQKKNGVVYTPAPMAAYLAREILNAWTPQGDEMRILDPAAGAAVLLAADLSLARERCNCRVTAAGFETDATGAEETQQRLRKLFPWAHICIRNEDFLEAVNGDSAGLYDIIIANPPYVRTQILGSSRAQAMADKHSCKGRMDLYYAFLLCAKDVLSPAGVAGYITSNKFMTIRSGCGVRNFMLENYRMREIVDLGDTKLFAASVLPCMLVFSPGKTEGGDSVPFMSVYETAEKAPLETGDIFEILRAPGTYRAADGRNYRVQCGTLQSVEKDAVWTLKTEGSASWLERVEANTQRHFKDIGKVRVGIKTTADNVFIGPDLKDMELLRPLITHRNAGRIIPNGAEQWKVLYTSTTKDGKRVACDLDSYPASKNYLLSHYSQLSSRTYLRSAGRGWYEIWVPQNPDAWKDRKIVFRDISEHPEFWLDTTGAVVNGDCYWIDIRPDIPDDDIYLALAVANSAFIERYYDLRFNTKLYSGKRRFMSQYVEQFPLPQSGTPEAQKAISLVKKIIAEGNKEPGLSRFYSEINGAVDALFA